MSDLSTRKLLIPYLITSQRGEFLRWYGVSAYSLDDALRLLRQYGYDVDLTDPAVTVREHPVLTEYEQRHIAPSMGPQQLRGVWYPQHNLGDSAGSASHHRD